MYLQESNVEKLALKIHLSKTTNMCRAWFGLPNLGSTSRKEMTRILLVSFRWFVEA